VPLVLPALARGLAGRGGRVAPVQLVHHRLDPDGGDTEAAGDLARVQAVRMAERLKKDHYKRMGRLSAQVRRIAREAQAELDRAAAS